MNHQERKSAFAETMSQVRDQLSFLKKDLTKFQDLKKQQKDSKSDQFKQLTRECLEKILFIKSGQRELTQIVENKKKDSENERRQVDIDNLTLQSMLYEKDYFIKEIHFCKEYRTPQLQQALLQSDFEIFKNLSPNISEYQSKEHIFFLNKQLKERQQLSYDLEEIQKQKKDKERDYQRKQKFVDDFPTFLKQLEEATLPLQDLLSVPITEDSNLLQQSQHLPIPLNSIFRKLHFFAKQYQQFNIDVSIQGEMDQIEAFYERYQTQLMNNPKYQIKVNRAKVQLFLDNATSNVISVKDEEFKMQSNNLIKSKEQVITDKDMFSFTGKGMPVKANITAIDGVSDNSKKIKKDKKKKNKKSASKGKVSSKNNQDGALEEGEEDINTDVNMVNIDIEFDPDEKPQQSLIDKYDKFPLYVEMRVDQNERFFDFKQPFTKYNQFSIGVLKDKTKTEIGLQMFPLTIRIFLVPELNVLTVEFKNKTFTTDQILGDLSIKDLGKQIKVRELQAINAESNERLYEWLHNWAGLFLDVQKSTIPSSRPSFTYGDSDFSTNENYQMLSTKLVVSKIWQRLISKSILYLQLDCFEQNKRFMKEVQELFNSVKEFQILIPKCEIRDFKKIDANVYEIVVEREKVYRYTSTITLPLNYPEFSPEFKLVSDDKQTHSNFLASFPQQLLDKIEASDLRAVENLRMNDQVYTKTGEPMQLILDSIEDELHIYYESYCNRDKHLDFLLSFQIRKLMQCLDILMETQNEKDNAVGGGITALYKKAIKGRFNKRPFSYNENLNLFEQR